MQESQGRIQNTPIQPFGHSCGWQPAAASGRSKARMASEDTMNMMIEDKVTSLKEELEEMIEEVKNDVDDRGSELAANRDLQNQSFNKLDKSMDKLRKELKQFGKQEEYTTTILDYLYLFIIWV